MTDSSNFNAFQVTATELSTVVHLNEAQKIYRDAVEQIRTDPLHKSLSPAEIDRITAIRSIDDLERDIRNERSQTKVWRTGKRSKLWDSADLCTEFLTRFEKSISVAAQISMPHEFPKTTRAHGYRYDNRDSDLGNTFLHNYSELPIVEASEVADQSFLVDCARGIRHLETSELLGRAR